MTHTSDQAPEWTLGIDLGDRKASYCWMDGSGRCKGEGDVLQTAKELELLTKQRPGRVRVAIEVGTHSGWVFDLMAGLGHEVFVANAHRMKLIAQSHRKTDRNDAELLARLGRSDPSLLCPIRHREKEAREDLQLLRSRDALVATRTDLVNHVRGSVKASGCRIPPCSTESFHKMALGHIPEALRPALIPVLSTIASVTSTLREFDRKVELVCENRYPETAVLRQVVGVGPITSLCFVLSIDDPKRFTSSRMVGPYLGLSPRMKQSGDRDPELGITKAGDTHLRRLLVSSAHYILGPFGPDTDLRRWGEELAARGGKNAKKRAVIAVARKLAVLLHSLWKNGTVYEPLRQSKRSKQSRSA